MIEGMYTAASGMAAQQMRLDAVANDLANTYVSVAFWYGADPAGRPGTLPDFERRRPIPT